MVVVVKRLFVQELGWHLTGGEQAAVWGCTGFPPVCPNQAVSMAMVLAAGPILSGTRLFQGLVNLANPRACSLSEPPRSETPEIFNFQFQQMEALCWGCYIKSQDWKGHCR